MRMNGNVAKSTGKYVTPVTFWLTLEQKKRLDAVSMEKDLPVSHLVRKAVLKKLLGKEQKNGR